MRKETKMNCMKCVAENKPESERWCFHDIAERFGLELVASFNDPQASYSFDEFCIWRRATDGALFYGQDSGCSCPSPFEMDRFETIDSLTPITPNSWVTFKTNFEAYAKHQEDEAYDPYRYVEAHVTAETIDKVRAMLYAKEPVR